MCFPGGAVLSEVTGGVWGRSPQRGPGAGSRGGVQGRGPGAGSRGGVQGRGAGSRGGVQGRGPGARGGVQGRSPGGGLGGPGKFCENRGVLKQFQQYRRTKNRKTVVSEIQ